MAKGIGRESSDRLHQIERALNIALQRIANLESHAVDVDDWRTQCVQEVQGIKSSIAPPKQRMTCNTCGYPCSYADHLLTPV